MRRPAAILLLLGLLGAGPVERARPIHRAGLGLAAELEGDLAAESGRRILAELRASGVSLFALRVSWPTAEPAPGKYDVESVLRAARILRQSGANVHLDLPLVLDREKMVPADLASTAFDDPKLSLRLGRLLDALTPALLDSSTLSLGFEADVYFYDKPEELKAFRRLFDGAVAFLQKKAPDLALGVTTLAPTESPAPVVAATIHQRSPVLFYVYTPFERERSFVHRAPSSIDEDWKRLIESAAGRPIAFPEVSYSSSPANSSSPENQAEFVRRLRHFVSSVDGSKLLFARYVALRESRPDPDESSTNADARRRAGFFAHRGLQTFGGDAKLAWKEWLKATR